MLTSRTGAATALTPPRDRRQDGDDTVLLTQRCNLPSRVSAVTSPLFEGASGDGPAPQVGRYRVLQRLGRGGMATVVRAHDPGVRREVALKFLHAELCEAGECRTRFLREARAAGGMSHPNIVVVHDVGEIDGCPYLAMELLGGGSLAAALAVGRPGGRQPPSQHKSTRGPR